MRSCDEIRIDWLMEATTCRNTHLVQSSFHSYLYQQTFMQLYQDHTQTQREIFLQKVHEENE